MCKKCQHGFSNEPGLRFCFLDVLVYRIVYSVFRWCVVLKMCR